ncbi:hypothetical protein SPI_09491 [Niveomyces insectorum RCEF 264]|uniref:Uncharacterized protein n=1 Tax=Niveomyces insectorum RCEF 264 TaxID=1081102 RepID=A0A167LGG8_9HYPO|nr:hypothetical protein SPI_09491 [Niveomyces insectorum RCEF 264]
MATTTIRDALRWKLPSLMYQPYHESTRPMNTESAAPIEAETWEPWPEFHRDVLRRIFTRELNKTYRGPPLQQALDADRCISSEDTVTAALYYFIWPVVNNALNSQHGRPHIV